MTERAAFNKCIIGDYTARLRLGRTTANVVTDEFGLIGALQQGLTNGAEMLDVGLHRSVTLSTQYI
ncbi:uncharacterized protein PHALS_11635 [Plasmopara halstedii]|uniref:Uncharacterized protein n=1 Tax=Plasmopara halstedii TaxID=4781 RepID=A0A0P1AK48_PLAHL|nr:uncharacterized protein PHALS_11635 [Plasmopara halstedii]CEG41278.1 hypothetical protein PHALS_11635 [Plasmopara halstedii]|eukprot:XP_024577647.1 hypothetical protein PHALS_11635 [Plasmopara halstedii]